MKYLASRSHRKYLEKLREIAGRATGYHLIAISGGMSFLHALSERTQSLILVDSDPEVNGYVAAVLEILHVAPSRWAFFELLTGHMSNRLDEGALAFTAELSPLRQQLLGRLSAATQQLLEESYPVDGFDPQRCTTASGVGTPCVSVVHYHGLTLAPMHFNWLSDWGVFASESTFRLLRETLDRLSPALYTVPLEQWDFSSCPPGTLILASNTDSPLFTLGDPVLHAIERSGNPGVKYVSRTRDFSLPDHVDHLPFAKESLTLQPIAVDFSDEDQATLRAAFPHDWSFVTSGAYLARQWYDEECLTLFSEGADGDRLINQLYEAPPIHQRLVLVGQGGRALSARLSAALHRYRQTEVMNLGLYRCAVHRLRSRVPYRFG